ncbi:MAG: S46 family peptidase [Pyrinomonadaceae bacterium]
MRIKLISTFILMAALVLSSVSFGFARPEEGMFTPDQIGQLPLKKKGLKIRPIDIYNPNGVGLTDAVMRVNIGGGGFGTGEFVSANGLILTNHHVGFDALVSASTPEKDYAKEGYRADSMANELPAKGYTLLLTKRVENVTDRVLRGTESLTGEERGKAIEKNANDLEKQEQEKAPKGATVRVQELNSGYFYYLYETQMIRDVRLVYAPPQNIGFFGGDPDNFEWTRHTGDFTFLRAYTAPDGSFAEYSPNNIPFKPKKHLTVSLDGLSANDFVFAIGYPGGTTRYRASPTIEYSERVNFPFLADYLRVWSEALVKAGEQDEEKRIKLQDLVFSLNNSIKVYEGNVHALKRADFVEKRKMEEAKFAEWIKADPARQAKYGNVLSNLERISGEYYATASRDRLLRSFPSAGTTPGFKQVYDAVQAVSFGKGLGEDDKGKEKKEEIEAAFKNREPSVEIEILKFFFKKAAELPSGQKFLTLEAMFRGLEGKARRDAEAELARTIVENEDFDSAQDIINLYGTSLDAIRDKHEKVVDLIVGLSEMRAEINVLTARFNSEIEKYRLLYMQGMSEMKGITPYPDANATLRFTYGEVKGYNPREAVTYTPFTTLKGVIDKDTGVFPFDVPQKLKDLQKAKDFGRYGVGDSVPVNFLATTDIIGGNSGSPMLNGNGEQVGIVFDGNYEGLGNDIFFNPDYGRTIAVDIRYVLFVTDKFGDAGWILNEMDIKGGKKAMTAKGR